MEGVRLHLEAESFPCRAKLSLYLVLSSPRKGKFSGKILVVNERTDKPIRYVKFFAKFEDNDELLPQYLDIGNCVFPQAGMYAFEVYFSVLEGEVLKGEHRFTVISNEE